MNNKNNHQKKIKGRTLRGLVVSDKMDKTAIVAVIRLKKHPKYKKRYKVTKRYKAHDEQNEYKIGDKVIIKEEKPISKEKKWRVISRINIIRDNSRLIKDL